MIEIYTLGTFNRSAEEFLEILKQCEIKVATDARRWLTSQWFAHFKKRKFKKAFEEEQNRILPFENLGGYRHGSCQAYTKTK